MDDPVNHPKHYTCYEHEVIELTEQLSFCLGNAVKYILRAPHKGKEVEDYEKALWYLNRLKEQGVVEIPTLKYELIASFKNPIISKLLIAALNDFSERIEQAEKMIVEAICRAQKKELEELRMKCRVQEPARGIHYWPCTPNLWEEAPPVTCCTILRQL